MNNRQLQCLTRLEEEICYFEKAKSSIHSSIIRTADLKNSALSQGYQSLYEEHEVRLAAVWQLHQLLISQAWE